LEIMLLFKHNPIVIRWHDLVRIPSIFIVLIRLPL